MVVAVVVVMVVVMVVEVEVVMVVVVEVIMVVVAVVAVLVIGGRQKKIQAAKAQRKERGQLKWNKKKNNKGR